MLSFVIRWQRRRKTLKPSELDQYPATSAGYYSGFHPGSAAPVTYKHCFRTRLQSLPELNTYPETPIDYYSGFYPGSALAITARSQFTCEHLHIPELNQYPETPAGYYSGFYPGSKIAAGFNYRFIRTSQQLPELNQYPATLAAAPVTSWLTHFEFTKNYTRRRTAVLELNQYPQTSEVPPVTAWVVHFEKSINLTHRRRLEVVLDQYTESEGQALYYPAWFDNLQLFPIVRIPQKRQLLRSEIMSFYYTQIPNPMDPHVYVGEDQRNIQLLDPGRIVIIKPDTYEITYK